jgi:hypothetical protein
MVLVAKIDRDLGHRQAGADELPNTDKPIAVVDEAAARSPIELHETSEVFRFFAYLMAERGAGMPEGLSGNPEQRYH